MYTEQQIAELADAMWQLLDDMGKDGLCVCAAAKAQARIAYDPFITDIEREAYAGLMFKERTMTVLDEIAAERKLQIARGYDAAHDDEHTGGEIARAAACFAANDPRLWPWGPLPIHEGGRRETLLKAAALLVAEIERFDRIDANIVGGCSTVTGAYHGS